MPSTRHGLTRDEKIDEILAAAERRLRSTGYQGLSIAALARELRVAQGAIYWYFPSKDELFVATLERMLHEIAARKPSRGAGQIEQVLWFTDQFEPLAHLRAAMSDRARESDVVADFVRDLDALLSRMLANAFQDRVPPDQLATAVDTFRATVEGTFVRGLSKRSRRKLLRFALEQFLGS